MVNIELGKRDFVWIGLLFVLVGVGFVYGYNSGADPDVMGHSSEEIAVDNVLCNAITGYDCGSIPADVNSISVCSDDEFLDGDGDCWSVADIVAGVGGAEVVCPCGECGDSKIETYYGCCHRTYSCTLGGWVLVSDDSCTSCA